MPGENGGLYRGEFLAGFSLPECPDFEDWLQAQREDLHRRALTLLERLSGYHEQAGGYAQALPFVLRYAKLEPWDENAQRSAMRLYSLNGQNSEAIAQYNTFCRILKKELGALPDVETQDLLARIRNGEVGNRSGAIVASLPLVNMLPVAERRQVTVLYCELPIAEIDDPDEAMTLLRVPQARCMEIIRQFSGHIVQTHSGSLLAYFGYPQAREDAARRAVQAALAVTRETMNGLEIRACVHTGLIITGGDAAMPDTVGITSKIAIQLRHAAAHRKVVISGETQRIVAGYFDCLSMGMQTISGFARQLEIFEVVQESGARTRLDAAATLTPLVGRKTEIAQLIKLWREVAQGAHHVVLVQGDAGIGKSRLLQALKDRLANEPHVIRELRCFPEFSHSPFYPLITLIETLFCFERGDTPEDKFGKLVKYLETWFPALAQEGIPLLGMLLSLPLGGYCSIFDVSAQKQKELTITILLDILQALAVRQPVLLILEDLHWIDPSTLELLTLFIGQQQTRSVLAVLTARPEFVPPWNAVIGLTLKLSNLVENDVMEMMSSIGKGIPATTIRNIVERADGVPLFVEEMTKIATGDNQARIPSTLHDLLFARIDNMGEAKFTAQLAASIGREFDMNLLAKVSPYNRAVLTRTLNALQDAGLILNADETSYQFKHALIQEAAYQSQSKSARQLAHQRIAKILQNEFADVVASKPEMLAQHFSSGGEIQSSIEYWIMAGQRASLNSANTEAIKHFNSGLQLLQQLPPDNTRDRLESTLRLNLGAALIAAKGYGSVEVGEAYSRALELCEQLGDNAGWYKALWGMWLTSSSRIGHLHALELAEKLLKLAEKNNDPLQRQLAHYAMGNSSLLTGNLSVSRLHLKRSMALYRPDQHETMVSQFGENICVSSGSLLAIALWLEGFSNQAEEVSRRTVALAREVDHPNSLGYALCLAAMLQRWLRKIESTNQLALEAIALSQQHGLPFWLGFGVSSYGWGLTMQGQQEGLAQMRQCLDAVNAVMSGSKVLFLAPMNEALIHLGQFDNALSEVNETLRVVYEKDDHVFESEFHRLKGVCLLEVSANNSAEAEICFNHALAVSRQQGAKAMELRATMSLARLWQQFGKHAEARSVLGEIFCWFTEGGDTLDLQEAAQLLGYEQANKTEFSL